MIVTEIDSSQQDSENCSNVEVIEIIENNNEINYEIDKSLNYYLDEDDFNIECCNFILEEIKKPISINDQLEYEEYFLSNENNSKDFEVESFTKTLKTLVDIVTEPIVDECPSISSTGSESSDDESFSIIPILKTISTKFIKQTSKFFRNDTIDLIDLNKHSSKLEYKELDIIDINSDNEFYNINYSDKYKMEEYFLDVKEQNEDNENNNDKELEDNNNNVNGIEIEEIEEDKEKENNKDENNNGNKEYKKEDKEENNNTNKENIEKIEDKKVEKNIKINKVLLIKNEKRIKENKNKDNKENQNDNYTSNKENDKEYKDNKEDNNNNNQVINKNIDWNISNLAKWF